MKNYIGFVNDHSGSMMGLARAAILDYNAQIAAVKNAATREMLDTVVSVVGVGLDHPTVRNCQVRRQVVISNPHVLKPIFTWPTPGGTPLYDGIGDMIELFLSLPDINSPDVSVLLVITTDGEEAHSTKYTQASLKQLIAQVSTSGRWTIAFRVPKQANLNKILGLGIDKGNIQEWDTTTAGMAASTVQTTTAMDSYFTARSAGAKATTAFYADASKVNVAALEDISKKVTLYVVPTVDNGVEIRPFILRHRMEYLKGAAFYQLTKTEARVAPTKMILVRDQATGKIFAGAPARKMIGLPDDRNARLHPGDHKTFDLFIQSESVNRKLVAGSGVIYWKEIGVPFTEADLAYLQPKPAVPAAPAVVQLVQVPVSNTPTKSPIPVQARYDYFPTREEARRHCAAYGITQADIMNAGSNAPKGRRWSVAAALAKKAA